MADAPASITRIGYLDFPLRSFAGEPAYAQIGSDGQGNYYEYDLVDSDLGTYDWTLITDDDDLERIRSGGLQASPQSGSPSVPAGDSSTDSTEPNKKTNLVLKTPGLKPKGRTSGSSLRYPDDAATTGESHYVLFTFKKYTPPFSAKAQESNGVSIAKASAAYNRSTNNLEDADLPQILLYMPEGVAASYKANWDGKAFGNVAAGILRSAGQAASGDYIKAIKAIGTQAEQTVSAATATLGAKGISALAKTLTKDSIGIQDIFSGIGGAILNPNVELIFGGHDLRTLQLTFKMVPYNKPEAEIVDNIVKTFKKAMLPRLNHQGSGTFWGSLAGRASTAYASQNEYGSGFIGVPDLVQISFMRGSAENDRVTRYKVCSITDFDVNYSPDGVYAVGPDGYPVATEIRVNFMESKLVYNEDIDRGF